MFDNWELNGNKHSMRIYTVVKTNDELNELIYKLNHVPYKNKEVAVDYYVEVKTKDHWGSDCFYILVEVYNQTKRTIINYLRNEVGMTYEA